MLVAIAFPVLGWPAETLAHGVSLDYRYTSAVELRAVYDSGEPMANAQVTIYAPDDPSQAWMTGTTDQDGHFVFVPDPSQLGNWDVKVRQSGHGDIVSIPLQTAGQQLAQSGWTQNNGGYTLLQKVVMGAVGVWGFVGTALFFSPRKEKQ